MALPFLLEMGQAERFPPAAPIRPGLALVRREGDKSQRGHPPRRGELTSHHDFAWQPFRYAPRAFLPANLAKALREFLLPPYFALEFHSLALQTVGACRT